MNSGRKKTPEKTTPAYIEAGNETLDSLDRLFLVISESKAIFLPAKLESERLLAKAARNIRNSADSAAQDGLQDYVSLAVICRITAEYGGNLDGGCRAGKLSSSRIKAYALVNNRELKIQ